MKSTGLKNIADQYGTPLYVFDLDEFGRRAGWIKNTLKDTADFCFALKANPFLLNCADLLADRFEICSPGEFALCVKAGIAPEKIVYSGVYKDPVTTPEVIGRIAGKGTATVESPAQLELLDKCAGESGSVTNVLIRITSGNQFGVDEEEACRMIRERASYTNLKITGFQMYTGTQKKKLRTIEKELNRLDALIARCADEYGFTATELEYGPGLPVNYFEDDAFDEEAMLTGFCSLLSGMQYSGHKCVEMGRFAASSCGYYLTSAGDVKTSKGQNIVICDGGSHQLKYFGQNMGMRIPFFDVIKSGREDQPADQNDSKWSIFGALCTVHDVIAREAVLDDPQPGDLFIFKNTGAYSVTEGMALFLSRDLPTVLSFDQGTGVRILRNRMAASDINCAENERK